MWAFSRNDEMEAPAPGGAGGRRGGEMGAGLVSAAVVSFDGGTYRATIRLETSEGGEYANVPTSRGCPAASMSVGARVLVWTAETNPARWVVVAVV